MNQPGSYSKMPCICVVGWLSFRSKVRLKQIAAGFILSGFSFVCVTSSFAREAIPLPAKPDNAIGDARISLDHELGKPDLQATDKTIRKADALANYLQGLLLEEEGNNEKAVLSYERAMQLDPGGVDSQLAVRVATEYVRRGDTAQALALLKNTIQAQPDEPLLHITAAYIYLKELNQPDTALKYVRQAVAKAPYDLRTHQALFVILDSLGDSEKTEKAIDQAANVDSDDSEFWFGIGDLYLRLYGKNRNEDQIDLLKMRKITAIYEKALAQSPENTDVQAKVADFYWRIGEVKKALPLYQKIIAESSNAPLDLQVDIREKLARIYYGMGKRPEAIELLRGLIKLNPLRSEAYVLLGDIYQLSEKRDLALASYQQALLTGKADPANYQRVANLALMLKQYKVAIEALIDARARFASPEFTTLLAIAYSLDGQNQEALTKFEEAVSESSSYDANTLTSSFYLSYADAAQRAGLVDKTVELIRKSIEIDPSKAHEGQNFLGYFWIDRGENLETGGQLVRQALLVEPENGAYLDSLGWYYFKTGRYDLALKQLLKAKDHMKEDDAVVFDHIAETYQKLGNTSEAIDYWKKALALDPENKSFAARLKAAEGK